MVQFYFIGVILIKLCVSVSKPQRFRRDDLMNHICLKCIITLYPFDNMNIQRALLSYNVRFSKRMSTHIPHFRSIARDRPNCYLLRRRPIYITISGSG